MFLSSLAFSQGEGRSGTIGRVTIIKLSGEDHSFVG